MTKRDLAKQSGYSRPAVDELLAKGATPEDIIEMGQARNAGEPEPTGPGETFLSAKRRKEIALADQRELELKQMAGDLVSIDDVNHWVASMILRARDILIRIGTEHRDRLAQETDPIKVQEVIDAEVHRALRELAEFKTA
jgi:hypothetical protein